MSCPHVDAPKVACGLCALCARAAGIRWIVPKPARKRRPAMPKQKPVVTIDQRLAKAPRWKRAFVNRA